MDPTTASLGTGAEQVAHALLIGLGATAVLDLWALALLRLAGVAPTNWCLVGRWFCHMRHGQFVHTSIAASPRHRLECAVGWAAHYAIGASYGVALLGLISAQWLADPAVAPALIFGLVTMALPMGVMQPCFGMGWAAARTPNPLMARVKTLVSHAVFGLGMFLSAVTLRALQAS